MCGIYALLCSKSCSLEEDTMKKACQKGQKRGPEYSSFSSPCHKLYFGFHRLAINGLDEISNQPLVEGPHQLICNGEIYNATTIFKNQKLLPKTHSDCEAILGIYARNGPKCVSFLDGVFALILYDETNKEVLVARDPYGVRPLYECVYEDNTIGFASDVAPLLLGELSMKYIRPFQPGCYATYKQNGKMWKQIHHERYFFPLSYQPMETKTMEYYMYTFLQRFQQAILKRVLNCERDIACLLSGGLDSSLISAYVARFYRDKKGIETYSIGLQGGEDLHYAKQVAEHIGSKHVELVMSHEDFIQSIPQVIYDIESFDTTTVRASVGNWNIGKYISNNSEAKVIFNGDGADELMGGYMYFHCCPNDEEFQNETLRLLNDIHRFDVLRSDKSISSHGLEPRTPFLDKELTRFYLSIPMEYRNHNHLQGEHRCEKYFIRKAIELYDPDLLPQDVLWRKKEAFSDGVSKKELSWYEILQNYVEGISLEEINGNELYHMSPQTKEQQYYRYIFRKTFPECCDTLIPYFWMPKYVEHAHDASARTLDIYNTY